MGTVTVWASKSSACTNDPVCVTVTFTVNSAAGAGEADSVNDAPVPSITSSPAAMLISGTSSSLTVTVAALFGEFATL